MWRKGESEKRKIDFMMTGIILLFFAIFTNSIAVCLPCATLSSTVGTFENETFVIKDGSAFGDIGEEYLTADQAWSVPAIWTVSPSCELESCSDANFQGKCTIFQERTQSPSDIWLSARCNCNRECTCSNVFMRKSVCARAYLEPGGCENCNARYTELSPDSDELFPEEWKSNVSSILVRSSCSLTVYAEEDMEGDSEVISDHSLTNWSGQFGSYVCKCDENTKSHIPPVGNQSTTQSLIDVPDSIDGVVSKLAENDFNQTGLLAALSSITHGRSSKNVYLLLIGSSGAGKSSAINNLFGSDMTRAGDHVSTTSDILEFRVPLPVPDLHIGNSELRIIDTPGLGDIRGLQNDALFLATLDEYLDNHEDLKSKIPNLVLIFHNFNDNRFYGDGAQFVRMIRALDTLRPRITDENYSNVLFVFSHYCTADKHLQKDPSPKLLKFKEVIEMYSFFPKPLQTVVIENKGRENELLMSNDNFELPNGERFPQNMFQKFYTITDKCEDKMGNAVFDQLSIIRHLEIFNTTQLTYPLVISSHPKVAKYMSTLGSAASSMNCTEISNLLVEAHKSMNSSAADKYPRSLENLQRYFYLKKIKSISDVPRTSTAILELLSGIEQNEATSYLLETALNLKAPEFPVDQVVGKSFDIFKNSLLLVSPFNMDLRNVSSIGFRLPIIINCIKNDSFTSPKPLNTFKIFDSKQMYFQEVSRSLIGDNLSTIASSSELFSALTSKINDGYFVREIGCNENENSTCFTVTRLYKTFQLDLVTSANTNSNHLKPAFVNRVQNLGSFNESDIQSVEEWTNFFNDFGTHVVKSVDGGGRIDIQFELSSEASPEVAVETILKAFDFIDDPLGSLEIYREDPRGLFAKAGNINHTLVFRGGNHACHFSGLSKLSLEQGYNLMKKWKHSLEFHPAVFPNEFGPIGQITESHLPFTKPDEVLEKIKGALDRLLSSNLKYVEPTPDPKILEQLERERMENEERLTQMELEAENKREEAEMLRLAEIEAHQKREQEARELEEQRQREVEAAKQKRREEEEERQRLVRQEDERRRMEQIEAEIRRQWYLRRWREEEERREERMWRRERERQRREEEERRKNQWFTGEWISSGLNSIDNFLKRIG